MTRQSRLSLSYAVTSLLASYVSWPTTSLPMLLHYLLFFIHRGTPFCDDLPSLVARTQPFPFMHASPEQLAAFQRLAGSTTVPLPAPQPTPQQTYLPPTAVASSTQPAPSSYHPSLRPFTPQLRPSSASPSTPGLQPAPQPQAAPTPSQTNRRVVVRDCYLGPNATGTNPQFYYKGTRTPVDFDNVPPQYLMTSSATSSTGLPDYVPLLQSSTPTGINPVLTGPPHNVRCLLTPRPALPVHTHQP